MAESLDPAVQARLARLAARGRVGRPTPAVAVSPPSPPPGPREAVVPPPPPPPAGFPPPPRSAVRAPAPVAPRPTPARRARPAEGSRLVVGVLSVATALGLVAGLAWGARQPATAQPSATPTVVVVTDPASGSGASITPAAPVPALPAPSTNSGGS